MIMCPVCNRALPNSGHDHMMGAFAVSYFPPELPDYKHSGTYIHDRRHGDKLILRLDCIVPFERLEKLLLLQ